MYLMRAGDIFAFPIGANAYLSGRVLLDIERQCVVPRRLAPGSTLEFYKSAMMVEVHGTPTATPTVADDRILITSLFYPASAFASGEWPVVGHRPVDPTQVDFPAGVMLANARPHLVWGEFALPIKMTFPEMQQTPSIQFWMNALDQLALARLGRTDEIDRVRYPTLAGLDLARNDLRYAPNASDLFHRAGLSAKPNYFEEALKRGHDTRRFYEQDAHVPISVCIYCWSVRTPDPICWACGEDTSRDPAIETSPAEIEGMKKKACGQCGTLVPDLAMRCPTCRSKVA